ncbi:MAG: type II toxin-antitoxin system VapC family toxin [Acidiphilium sp.]
MNLLLDTHLLLWAAADDPCLTPAARALIDDPANMLWFSAASLWEVAIKRGLGRPDFTVDPAALRHGLLEQDYRELAVTGAHAAATAFLPAIHKDPFDRMLVAQATHEQFPLLTGDARLAGYGGFVRIV